MIKTGRSRTMFLIIGIVLTMFLLQPPPYASAALTIDDFEDAAATGPIFRYCNDATPIDDTKHPSAQSIGDYRTLSGQITNTAGCTVGQPLSVTVGSGVYSFGANPSVEADGDICWSGATGCFQYSLPLAVRDFQANGEHFVIRFVNLDKTLTVTYPMYLDIYTDATHGSRAIITHASSKDPFVYTVRLATDNAGLYNSYFSTTPPGTVGHATFTDVREVRLSWGGIIAQDFELDEIVLEGEATVSCVSKTFNGNPSITIDPVTGPPGTDINVCVTVKNDATSTAPTAIWVLDTLDPSAAGQTWAYVVGSTNWTCSNPADPCPTPVQQPTVGVNTLEWTTNAATPSTLEPDQSMTICYTMRVTDLASGNHLESCASVKEREIDPYPACGSQCRARVTARTSERVPSMSGWGAIATFIVLGAVGVYLMRRKRGFTA